MKSPTPRDLFHAVLLAVAITIIVMLALFEASRRRDSSEPRSGPRTISTH